MSKHGSTQKLEEKQKRDVKNRSSEQVEDDDDENDKNETSTATNEKVPFLVGDDTSGTTLEDTAVGGKDHNNNNKIISRTKQPEIKKKHTHEKKPKLSHVDVPDLYIELEELFHKKDGDGLFYNSCGEFSEHQWRIVSRWIKYEQTIDPETNIWSKPYVGALVYQNLAYLKSTFQTGTVIFDSNQANFESLMDEIIGDIISRGHMNRERRENLKALILSQHRSRSTIAGTITRKPVPLSELFSSDSKHSRIFKPDSQPGANPTTAETLGSSILKGSSFFHSSRRRSFLLKNNAEDEGGAPGDRNSSDNEKEKKHSPVRLNMNESGTNNNLATGNSQDLKHSSNNIKTSHNLFNLNNFHLPHHLPHHHHNHHHHHHLHHQHHHHFSSKTEDGKARNIESFLIMVGAVDFLDRPIMAFVRLTNDQFIDHLAEYQVKVRFLFLFFGPDKPNIDYHEIGRCMGTLMTNRDFHDLAYMAKNRQDLVKGITTFSNKNLCLVLPIGEYDEDLLGPAMDWIQKLMIKKKTKIIKNSLKKSSVGGEKLPLTPDEIENTGMMILGDPTKKHSYAEPKEFDPFKRTGHPFGSLFNEIKHRYAKYVSDITDGLNWHCFFAFIFIFTVCVAPALCFGGIMADKTDQTFGINEMLLATSLNGIVFSLFSGQPLMIFGATGPFLVFEEMLYNFCIRFCIEFLAARIWVALWVLVFSLVMLASESTHIIHFVTRFTEEIFAFLIACVFLSDAIKKMFYYFYENPIYKTEKYCEYVHKNLTSYLKPNLTTTVDYDLRSENSTSEYFSNLTTKLIKPVSTLYSSCHQISYKVKKDPQPNIALISLMLLIGTCGLALLLKKLRRSNFFGSYLRRTLSDVGILISIVLMVLVDLFIKTKSHVNTQKLDIPNDLRPTRQRSWFVSPLGNNFGNNDSFQIWVPFAAILPALIIFIVLFLEVELTGIILSAKHRKLKKGTGFNLDLLIGAFLMAVNSFFGLPWMCSAPVRTLAHWASLTIYTNSLIPGEKPKLTEVKEQRLTNLLVHFGILLCLQAKFLLRIIPVPVLFGVFLYFGIVSLSGTQLYERIHFLFTPFKHCPNLPYAIGVRPTKRNIFTILQILGVIVLLAFKMFANISFMFPIVLVLLVPFRKFVLPKFFSHRELEALDDENEHLDDDMVHDFYELTHLPI